MRVRPKKVLFSYNTTQHNTNHVQSNACSFIGFNPVWDETITFILTFPELTIFRFVVWDEDPIGRDFIGQVTFPFSSLMPGKLTHTFVKSVQF